MAQIQSRSFCKNIDKTFAVTSGAVIMSRRRRGRRHKVGNDGAVPTISKGNLLSFV